MDIRLLGAVLVVTGCGGVGFTMAYHYKRELHSLRQLVCAVEYMISDLQYRQTPLPELISGAAGQCTAAVRNALEALSRELESQIAPDVKTCMSVVLSKQIALPRYTSEHMDSLGNCLGIFDLQGQINGLQAVREACETTRKSLEDDRAQRLRSYQTLGLCAGAALAILFV